MSIKYFDSQDAQCIVTLDSIGSPSTIMQIQYYLSIGFPHVSQSESQAVTRLPPFSGNQPLSHHHDACWQKMTNTDKASNNGAGLGHRQAVSCLLRLAVCSGALTPSKV